MRERQIPSHRGYGVVQTPVEMRGGEYQRFVGQYFYLRFKVVLFARSTTVRG